MKVGQDQDQVLALKNQNQNQVQIQDLDQAQTQGPTKMNQAQALVVDPTLNQTNQVLDPAQDPAVMMKVAVKKMKNLNINYLLSNLLCKACEKSILI
jgi:hypothetical protein